MNKEKGKREKESGIRQGINQMNYDRKEDNSSVPYR